MVLQGSSRAQASRDLPEKHNGAVALRLFHNMTVKRRAQHVSFGHSSKVRESTFGLLL